MGRPKNPPHDPEIVRVLDEISTNAQSTLMAGRDAVSYGYGEYRGVRIVCRITNSRWNTPRISWFTQADDNSQCRITRPGLIWILEKAK